MYPVPRQAAHRVSPHWCASPGQNVVGGCSPSHSPHCIRIVGLNRSMPAKLIIVIASLLRSCGRDMACKGIGDWPGRRCRRVTWGGHGRRCSRRCSSRGCGTAGTGNGPVGGSSRGVFATPTHSRARRRTGRAGVPSRCRGGGSAHRPRSNPAGSGSTPCRCGRGEGIASPRTLQRSGTRRECESLQRRHEGLRLDLRILVGFE